MSITEDHKSLDTARDKEAKVYELGYLVLPSVTEESLSDVVNAITSIIKKEGAKELDSEFPIKFDLAYTMSKTTGARKYVVDDAYIGWIKFEGEPEVAPKVKDTVEKLDEILRVLLVKAPRETTFTFAQAEKERLERETPTIETAEAPAEVAPEIVVE